MLARKDGVITNKMCMTNLGLCGTGTCDSQCCQQKCVELFQSKNPVAICQLVPGFYLCNCYHDCD